MAGREAPQERLECAREGEADRLLVVIFELWSVALFPLLAAVRSRAAAAAVLCKLRC